MIYFTAVEARSLALLGRRSTARAPEERLAAALVELGELLPASVAIAAFHDARGSVHGAVAEPAAVPGRRLLELAPFVEEALAAPLVVFAHAGRPRGRASAFAQLLRAHGIHELAGCFAAGGGPDGRPEGRGHFSLWVGRPAALPALDAKERALLSVAASALALVAAAGDSSGRGAPPDEGADPLAGARLTVRERDVVVLAARGMADREIARRLSIGFATVRTYLARAFLKLGVSNRTELASKIRPPSPGPGP